MSKRTIGILSILSVMLALVGAGLIVAGIVGSPLTTTTTGNATTTHMTNFANLPLFVAGVVIAALALIPHLIAWEGISSLSVGFSRKTMVTPNSSGYKENESQGGIYARPTYYCDSATRAECNGSISRWHRLTFSKQYASAAAISQSSFSAPHSDGGVSRHRDPLACDEFTDD